MMFCSALLAASGAAAQAAGRAPPETVTNRERPETDPLGMRLGVWRLDASLALGYVQDDNVLAADADEMDDDILLLRPEARLASDWSRHALRVGGEASIARYSDFDEEDYEDWRVFAEGRLDLPAGNVAASLGRLELHEERTSPDDLGGLEPTTYSVDAAELSWLYEPGALRVRPDVRYRALSFDPTPVATPADPDARPARCTPSGAPGIDTCSNEDRDRDLIDAGLRIGYAMTPGYDLFVEGRLSSLDYDRRVDFNGFERSSDGYELLAGSTFALGSTTFGEVYAGYRHWSFDDDRFETIDGLAFGADVTWNVTPLTTLGLAADRRIESTTIVGASGIERTAVGLSADHELLRNLLLWARVATVTEDFEGIDREDDLTELGIGARYLMSRRLYVLVGFEREERDGSGADASGQEYDITRLEVRLQGNL
jgi:hypothetical protein